MATRLERVSDLLQVAGGEGMTVEALMIILNQERTTTQNALYVALNQLKCEGLAEWKQIGDDSRKTWYWVGEGGQRGVAANLDWATRLLARSAAQRTRLSNEEIGA